MADPTYQMKDNTFKAKPALVDTKCTGFPDHHLTAKPGDIILEFPFDASVWKGIYSGSPIQIPIPAEVFKEHFAEMKAAKSSSKATK